jgi:outer membrane protein assembly factor BamD
VTRNLPVLNEMLARAEKNLRQNENMLSLTTMKTTGLKNGVGPIRYRTTFQRLALAICLGMLPGLAGCGSSTPSFGGIFESKTAPKNITGTPEELYRIGDARMNTGNYAVAIRYFEEVDRQHPYSPLARRAIVMASYANYKAGKYPEAIAGAKRYVTLHPGTKEAALAQYIISSSYFDRIKNPNNDQTATRKALQELNVLVRRYPNSRYVAKVKNRIKIANDVLAAQEMEVGRYYLKNNNYLAAINRFKTVVKSYQTTEHVEEALARLTEAYLAMGITNEAQSAAAILGHNFPSSTWYHDSYALLKSGGLEPREHKGSWVSRTWKTVTKAVLPG